MGTLYNLCNFSVNSKTESLLQKMNGRDPIQWQRWGFKSVQSQA